MQSRGAGTGYLSLHLLGRRVAVAGASERSVRKHCCFPATSLMNERFIEIGENTMIGPHVALSAGMAPGQECLSQPVVRIGDRCLIGRSSGIVGHFSIDIGDDVWTGHHVYITDQNLAPTTLTSISQQSMPEKPVRIGSGSWLGHGTVVLPGADIGETCGDRRKQCGDGKHSFVQRCRWGSGCVVKSMSEADGSPS